MQSSSSSSNLATKPTHHHPQLSHPPGKASSRFRCCTFLASLQPCKSFEYLCNSSNQTNDPGPIGGRGPCNSCSSLVALTHFQKSRVIIGLADICLKLATFKSCAPLKVLAGWLAGWLVGWFKKSLLLFYANTRKCPNFFYVGGSVSCFTAPAILSPF